MSVRNGKFATFTDDSAHAAMLAGFEWAQRGHWLLEASMAKGSILRPSYIRNAIDAHRKMMQYIRRARQAGAV